MATRKPKVKRETIPPFDLPVDVVDILLKINLDLGEAIAHLARGYDAMMEEQGADSNPIHMPPTVDAELTKMGDMPTRKDVDRLLEDISQPRGSLAEVRLRVHDKSLPRDADGLVRSDYIMACNAPIVESLLRDQTLDEETFTIRFTAIREVLSATPEDIWATALQIPIAVDRRYAELLEGRRPIGKKI